MELRYEPGDNKILHDEYFGEKPSAAYLLTVRLVLLCLMSATFILMFCDLYGFQDNRLFPAAIAVGVSALTYILASIFPAGIVYGSELLILAASGFILRKTLLDKAGWFWDHLMLKLDSRLINTSGMFVHDSEKIKAGYFPYVQAMDSAFFLAAIILALIIPIIFTAAVRTRIHLSVPVLFGIIIIAPNVMAESAGYIPTMIAFIVCVFGFEAIHTSYELDSGFIFGSLSSAHLARHRGDAQYRERMRFVMLKRKIDGDTTRYHRYSTNLISLSAVTALVFFGVGNLIPEGTGISYQEVFDAIEDMSYKIADTFGNMFGTTFGEADEKGYFGTGTFGNISSNISIAPPSASDRPVIEVTLSRNDIPVYMRGDIGVDFVNNSWTSVKTVDLQYKEAVSPEFCPETEYQVFRLALAAQGISPEDAMPLQMVSTRYLRNTRVVFQPLAAYELTYKTNPNYENIGDFVLRTKNSFVKSYECLSLTPTITMPDFSTGGISGTDHGRYLADISYAATDRLIMQHSIPAAEMDNDIYMAEIESYRRFVENEYMRSDPIVDELINNLWEYGSEGSLFFDFYDGNDNYKAYYACMLICNYFRDNFKYSLDADNGNNQLESFLYTTHQGHCALYATAMTLVLRELGYPARYVTGYVAEGISEKVPGGYKYTLSERQLHAWVEVYFRGIGWLPFDPTAAVPGYAEVTEGKWDGKGEYDNSAGTTPDVTTSTPAATTSAAPETTAPDTTSAPKTEDITEDTTVPGGGDNGSDRPEKKEPGIIELIFTKYLYIVITAAAIILIAVILIVFTNKVTTSEKKVLKSFRRLPPFEACSVMYRFILTLLKKKGIEPQNEMFSDFAERVDGTTLLKDTSVFMMDVMPVFEKCEFGNAEVSPVSDDEREAVYRFTAALYSKIMNGFSPMKRFFVKISLFL